MTIDRAMVALVTGSDPEANRVAQMLEPAQITSRQAAFSQLQHLMETGAFDLAIVFPDVPSDQLSCLLSDHPIVLYGDAEALADDALSGALKSAIIVDRAAPPAMFRSTIKASLRLRGEQVRARMLEEALGRAESRSREATEECRRKDVELRAQLERVRLLGEAFNSMMWDWDLETGTVDRNSAALEFGDRDRAEPTEDWWRRNMHPDDRERVLESIRRKIISGEQSFAERYRFRRRDGAADGGYAHVHARGYIVRDEGGRATRIVGTTVDLTELQDTQDELVRTRNELIHVSRLSAMGTMASVLAHELNQPLAAITNYIQAASLGLSNGAEASAVTEILQHAKQSALRAGDIVRRLREFVAKGNVKRAPTDVDLLVREACSIAMIDASTLGIRYRIESAPEPMKIAVDRIQIQQVLVNLLRNAVETVEGQARREIVVTVSLRAAEVEICVSDSGPGVAEDARDELFTPFNTSKTHGMGIGLSLSRTIVEAHGGRLWLADPQQGGATFCFTMPLAPAFESVSALTGRASAG